MPIEEFLKSKKLDVNNIVIYNMNNITNPKVPFIDWLKEFEIIIKKKLNEHK